MARRRPPIVARPLGHTDTKITFEGHDSANAPRLRKELQQAQVIEFPQRKRACAHLYWVPFGIRYRQGWHLCDICAENCADSVHSPHGEGGRPEESSHFWMEGW